MLMYKQRGENSFHTPRTMPALLLTCSASAAMLSLSTCYMPSSLQPYLHGHHQQVQTCNEVLEAGQFSGFSDSPAFPLQHSCFLKHGM